MAPPTLDLIEAARNGKLTQLLIHVFQQDGGDINGKASNGLTLLSAAAMGGSKGAVRTLLKYNANVNLASKHNCTPLWFATRILNKRKAQRVVKELLGAGADVEVVSDAEMMRSTPLMNALRANQDPKVISILAKKASPDFGPTSGTVREQSNATAVASFLGNKIYEARLQNGFDLERHKASRSSFVTAINKILDFVVSVVNKFTSNSVERAFGVKSKPESNHVGLHP